MNDIATVPENPAMKFIIHHSSFKKGLQPKPEALVNNV